MRECSFVKSETHKLMNQKEINSLLEETPPQKFFLEIYKTLGGLPQCWNLFKSDLTGKGISSTEAAAHGDRKPIAFLKSLKQRKILYVSF